MFASSSIAFITGRRDAGTETGVVPKASLYHHVLCEPGCFFNEVFFSTSVEDIKESLVGVSEEGTGYDVAFHAVVACVPTEVCRVLSPPLVEVF